MGIEQRPMRESVRLKNLKAQVTLAAVRLTRPIVEMGTQNIINKTETKYEDGFTDKLVQARMRGDVIIAVINHQSLADTLISLPALNRIRKISGVKGYGLPYTMTVANGDKGAGIKGLHEILEQKLRDNMVEPIYLSRIDDQEDFNTPPNLREVYEAYRTYIEDGYAIAIHAEGNLDASRRGKNGQRQGMQHFQTNALRGIINITRRLGKNVTIVPITVSGSYNIHDPLTGGVTRSALRVGFNFSDRSLASIFVSKPMTISEGALGEIRDRNPRMKPEDWDEFNTVIESQIASHLPRKMQGIHAKLKTPLKVS